MKTIIAILVIIFFAAALPTKTVYDFKMKDIDGKEVSLSEYKGRVLLIVNVASLCGNTPQYRDIEALYKKYKNQGFAVLGFPSNDFMGQEPGNEKEIKEFCTSKYGITFPLFSKISVKPGKNIHPLYSYLTQKSENGVLDAKVTWNFQKFLISKNGTVIRFVSPRTSVDDAEVMSAIDKAIAE